jgi:hypothetical protein
MNRLCTVITAAAGNPLLIDNIKSVSNQSYDNIQHLIVVDGGENRWESVNKLIDDNNLRSSNIDLIRLPYSIGKDRYNGHRIYGASTYIAEGDYLMYLDDDNYLEKDHVKSCVNVIENGVRSWSYSLRNIVDKDRNHLCQDNCESLGKWHSVINPNDFFIDVNCYFIPKTIALLISSLWYRKFREPGQMEVDRALIAALKQVAPNFDCTYQHSVNYTVGNTTNSVQKEFFIQGNERMLQQFNGKLPWIK